MQPNILRSIILRAAVPATMAWAGPPDSARAFADRIAARYGSAEFPRVESVRFDFHLRRGKEEIVRHWTWFPRNDSVVFRGKDPKGVELQAAYSRKNPYSLSSETVAGIDKSFLHDQYWLFFPLHLAWDRGLELELGENGRLTVRYPSDSAGHPGDAYALFASPDGTIRAWDFPESDADTAAAHADWSQPKSVDGLPLSLERKGPKGFKVWFTDVKVSGLKP